jgi:hypothetical protein
VMCRAQRYIVRSGVKVTSSSYRWCIWCLVARIARFPPRDLALDLRKQRIDWR